MRDPERLLNAGATEPELMLLSAAAAEQPPADGPDRLRAMLGVSAMTLVSGAAVASAHSAPPVAAANAANAVLTTGKTAAVAAAAKVGSSKLLVGALALALTGAGVVTGVVMLRKTPVHETAPRAAENANAKPALPSQRAPSALDPAMSSDVINHEARDGDTAVDAERSSDVAPRRRAGRATPKLAQSIARETADLDAARVALRQGRAPVALRELDRYMQAHPRGVLRQEATVLRIEALLGSREVARAKRAGGEFLRAHPESPYAARVRALIDDAPAH